MNPLDTLMSRHGLSPYEGEVSVWTLVFLGMVNVVVVGFGVLGSL